MHSTKISVVQLDVDTNELLLLLSLGCIHLMNQARNPCIVKSVSYE